MPILGAAPRDAARPLPVQNSSESKSPLGHTAIGQPFGEQMVNTHKIMAPSEFSDEQISEVAKRIWEEEGRPDGKAEDHWSRAKSELHEQQIEIEIAARAAGIATPPIPVGMS
jgi:hypothetical protein